MFHPSFPVDVRHNAKIFSEKLAEWADEHLDEQNLNVAVQAFDAFANHDPSFLQLVHPDIECVIPASLPGGGEFRGQLKLIEFFAGMTEVFDDPMIYPEKYVVGEDELVVFGRWKATVKRTGIPIDVAITMRWTFADRMAVRYQSFLDTAAIAKAL
jgi:ketosteroid isomerase-like protein